MGDVYVSFIVYYSLNTLHDDLFRPTLLYNGSFAKACFLLGLGVWTAFVNGTKGLKIMWWNLKDYSWGNINSICLCTCTIDIVLLKLLETIVIFRSINN